MVPHVETSEDIRASFSAGNHGARGHSLAINKEDMAGPARRLEGNIRSGYPLPLHWNDSRRIGIPARRFTVMTDLVKTLITTLHKTGDGTIFRVVAASLAVSVRITGGDGLFLECK